MADIGDLGGAIDASIASGHLSSPTAPDAKAPIFWRYLQWLGYMRGSNKFTGVDARLTKAIKEFQSDLGWRQTGKLDKKTFSALNQLVAFETHGPSRPLVRKLDKNNPALIKARALRLKIYGLILNRAKAPGASTLAKGLKHFHELAFRLGLPAINQQFNIRALDNIIFNIDFITKHIKGSQKGIVFTTAGLSRTKKDAFKKRVVDFIRNVAGIELWLHGYDIELEKIIAGKVYHGPYLKVYWRSVAEQERPLNRYRERLSGYLFQHLSQSTDEPVAVDNKQISQSVNEQLSNKAFRDKVQAQSQNILSRLWDGIKRALKRIWLWVKRKVGEAIELVKNAARFIVSGARQFYTTISHYFRVAKIGFQFLFSQDPWRGDPEQLLMVKHGDFDIDLYFNKSGSKPLQKRIVDRYGLAAKMLSVSLKVIKALLQLFRQLILLPGVASGFALFVALIRLRDSVANLLQFRRLVAELSALWQALKPA